jgi:hypothetical protein
MKRPLSLLEGTVFLPPRHKDAKEILLDGETENVGWKNRNPLGRLKSKGTKTL